jgi:cell division protein FtsQ
MSDTALINRTAAALALIASVAILWSVFAWLNTRGAFAIRSVEVASRPVNVDVGLLEAAIRSDIRGTFFTASPQRIRAALKKLPWVRDAVVERRWPLSIRVSIEEYQATAYWGENELLSDRGEIFRATATAPMPRFDGPTLVSAEALARYREAKLALAPLGLEIKSVAVSPRASIAFVMTNGLVIEMGRDQFEQRLARFVAVYSNWSASEREAIARIDLRYRSAIAVARKDQSTPKLATVTSAAEGRTL